MEKTGKSRNSNIFSKEFNMRRWYFAIAAGLSLAVLSGLGSSLFSGGKANGKSEPETPAAPKVAKSKIDKVTVYPHNALVTREVEVPEGNGLVELVVNPMPDQIVSATMYAEGTEHIRVLTTRFRTRQVLEDTSEERRKLETELEKFVVLGS